MSGQQFDGQGEARDALNTAVTDYGSRVLSDPRILANVVTDLLPDLPRERNLLVTGAEADVAGELRRHVEEQHISPDTAVQMVAGTLSERRAIEPDASMWIAAEYARALGYPVRPASQQSGWQPPRDPISDATTVTGAPQGPPVQGPPVQGPPVQGPPVQGPPVQGPPVQGPPDPRYPGYPPPGAPPGPPVSWPPTPPTPASRPPKRNRGPVIAAASVAGVLVLYFAIAAAASIVPFAKSASHKVIPTVRPTPVHPSTPHPTSTVLPVVELLPDDVDDPTTQCKSFTPPFSAPGLTKGLQCNDPGLPNGLIQAYQMNSLANYQAAWASFNSWWGFAGTSPGPNCPPAAGNTGATGTTTWHDSNFQTRAGQVLECEWTDTNNNDPAYAWSYPTENAFIIAWNGPNTTFDSLNKWFNSVSESIYASASASASS
jgi:hypothetical protein